MILFILINDSGSPIVDGFDGVYAMLLWFMNIVKMVREQILILVALTVSTYNIITISFWWESFWLMDGPIVIT